MYLIELKLKLNTILDDKHKINEDEKKNKLKV